MKQVVIAGLVIFLSCSLFAQIKTPPLSQRQVVEQMVGFTEVTIEYGRPLMRGRQIFGALVEYDKIWRTGANRNTQLTVGQGITVGNKNLDAGTYTIFTRPSRSEWKVYFYPYDNGYGVPDDFQVEKAITEITVGSFELNRSVENLTINLDNVTDKSAELVIMWENTGIAIPLDFSTETDILSDIDNLVNSHSSDYYKAAKYYLDKGKDLEKAKSLIQRAIDLRTEPGGVPKFWIFHTQAKIFLANNEHSFALDAAEKAMALAKSRGDDDFYVKQIKEMLDELKN